MSAIKKHVGKIKSTDQRCVVVFMQLPDDKEKALIINVESLAPRYEQLLLEVVDSAEGQQEKDLANAMARRLVPETKRTIIEEFHARGLMRAEPIDNIIMMPRPNTPFPLRDILSSIGALDPVAAETQELVQEDVSKVKYNPVQANMQAADADQRAQMARNMLMEADMLLAEANKKREQAYQYAPHLRPKFATGARNPSELQDTPITQGDLPAGLVITETGELKKVGAGRPNKEQLAAIEAYNGKQANG